MSTNGSVAARRSTLGEWYTEVVQRNRGLLASERVRRPVRVRGRTLSVTSEQFLDALERTYCELHQAFATRPAWGVNPDGSASRIAVLGLAQRRFESRLLDRLRQDARRPEFVCLETLESLSASRIGFDAVSRSPDASLRVGNVLVDALIDQTPITREVVLRSAAGYAAPEIAEALEITSAAVRQRLSRFSQRLRDEVRDAA